MTHQEVWMDVKLMHRQGASIREIARRTGLSRDTVRKILSQKAPKPYAPRPERPPNKVPSDSLTAHRSKVQAKRGSTRFVSRALTDTPAKLRQERLRTTRSVVVAFGSC